MCPLLWRVDHPALNDCLIDDDGRQAVVDLRVPSSQRSHRRSHRREMLCLSACHRSQLRPLDELELASVPYRDFIQVPLQPLQDNLEACTYETFEKDTIKYTTYQEAITQALRDLSALRKAGLTQQEGKPLNVMVVGAGRGPLVRCSLEASKETGIPIHVWAVEKNRNALVTLRDIIASEALGSQVRLIGFPCIFRVSAVLCWA